MKLRRGVTIIEMAIVLLVLSILIVVVTSIIGSSGLLRTPGGAAESLSSALQVAAESAVMHGDLVYFEIDIDQQQWRAWRLRRGGREAGSEQTLIPETSPGVGNRIVELIVGTRRLESGKSVVTFYPDGSSEELRVGFGRAGGEVDKRLYWSKYGARGRVIEGEASGSSLGLEREGWRHRFGEW